MSVYALWDLFLTQQKKNVLVSNNYNVTSVCITCSPL